MDSGAKGVGLVDGERQSNYSGKKSKRGDDQSGDVRRRDTPNTGKTTLPRGKEKGRVPLFKTCCMTKGRKGQDLTGYPRKGGKKP